MSLSPKSFYTAEAHDAIKSHSITSEVAGFPIENVLDWNLDTYWKPTSTATQTIEWDLGSAYQIVGTLIWVHNYLTDNSNSGTARLESHFSDNGSDWTFNSGNAELIPNLNTPIQIIENTVPSDLPHRYWRNNLILMDTIIEISSLMLFFRRNITANNEYPIEDVDIFPNRSVSAAGSRMLVSGINRNFHTEISRDFLISGTTDFNTLRDVFRATKGSLYPFVMTEGGVLTSPKLVRLTHDDFQHTEIDHEVFRPRIDMVTLPYIEDGQVF